VLSYVVRTDSRALFHVARRMPPSEGGLAAPNEDARHEAGHPKFLR
jgi:hypothetical protein